MADEFINWLDTSNSRTGFNNNNNSSSASISSSGNNSSMLLFQDTRDKLLLQTIDPGSRGVLMDHSVQVMAGLGLSSQPNQDWNQSSLNGKPDAGFGCILEEENQLGLNVNYQPESVTRQNFQQWRTQPKIFSAGGVDESCSNQRLPISNTNNFQVDNNFSFYENNSSSPSTMLQGFLGPSFENNHQRSIDYNYPSYASNYDMSNHSDVLMLPKFSHHLMPSTTSSSPPIQMVTPQSQLHFSNVAPFWNASATTTTTPSTTTTMSDHVSSSFLPNSLHRQQMSMSPDFDQKKFKTNVSEKSSNSSSGAMKKSTNSEVSLKRPRNETSSSTPLPAFKVRKEKMGDRITALQQLVSPFGKTDTASVLSEAIEYIKLLHEQVAVLSTPYMKNGASIQQQHHHQGRRNKNKDLDGTKQDLRSRGLCLVPISSTFPMTHETSVDFWTPTFGGTFR